MKKERDGWSQPHGIWSPPAVSLLSLFRAGLYTIEKDSRVIEMIRRSVPRVL